MTNPYYTPTGTPVTRSVGSSSLMRAEMTRIEAAFDAVYAAISAGSPGGTTILLGSLIPDTDNAYALGSSSYRWSSIYAATAAFTSGTLGSEPLGTSTVPVSAGWVTGACWVTTTGQTLNTSDMVAGRIFSMHNNSASAITVTQGAGVTMRLSGTAFTGSVEVAPYGTGTFWCRTGAVAIASGDVTLA